MGERPPGVVPAGGFFGNGRQLRSWRLCDSAVSEMLDVVRSKMSIDHCTWEIDDSKSSGFSPCGFTIFAPAENICNDNQLHEAKSKQVYQMSPQF